MSPSTFAASRCDPPDEDFLQKLNKPRAQSVKSPRFSRARAPVSWCLSPSGEVAPGAPLADRLEKVARDCGLEDGEGRRTVDAEQAADVAIGDRPRAPCVGDDRLDLLVEIDATTADSGDLTEDAAGAAAPAHGLEEAAGHEALEDASALAALEGPEGAQVLLGDGSVPSSVDESDLA